MKLSVGYMGFTPEQLQKFAALGFEVRTIPDELAPCPEALKDTEAIICFQFFNHNDISEFRSLRLIQTASAGIDHLPLDYIKSHGITLCNARGVFSAPMAEFALGGVLQLYKRAPLFRRQQAGHVWKQDRSLLELDGKRVCIVGAGSIGAENARRFSAMGCRVTGLRRHPAPEAYFDEILSMDELDAVLPESDIVILSLPLTAETRRLFGRERFARMKEGAVFVNIARGPIADTAALVGALESGRLLGAVVDVVEPEPLPADSPLWDMENVILTPHNSFVGEYNRDRMFDLACRNLARYLSEHPQERT